MSGSITVRGIDPSDKSWLRREAHRAGVSIEELVRRLIREKRMADRRPKPSEAFARHFGEKHGIDHLELPRYGYRWRTSRHRSFWESPTLQELANAQSARPVDDLHALFGTWLGEKDDGFEEAVDELRRVRSS